MVSLTVAESTANKLNNLRVLRDLCGDVFKFCELIIKEKLVWLVCCMMYFRKA